MKIEIKPNGTVEIDGTTYAKERPRLPQTKAEYIQFLQKFVDDFEIDSAVDRADINSFLKPYFD